MKFILRAHQLPVLPPDVTIRFEPVSPHNRTWTVDLTLDTLLELVQTAGRVVLHPPDSSHALFTVEIYDGYRE